MGAHGVTTFVPQFRVRLPQVNRIVAEDARWLTIRACNGEIVPSASAIQKNLSIHVDNSQTSRQFSLNGTAAWLQTEVHWEALPCIRNADIHKRKFAEQVKKEDKNVRRTVLKSIVGTLDISIRQYFSGETYPGEIRKSTALFAAPKPFDAHKYAYISNVCVSKYARRKGIATNMLNLAADVASFTGMKSLFVHVNADNTPAQELYRKCGLKFLETPSPQPPKDNNNNKLLMYMEL